MTTDRDDLLLLPPSPELQINRRREGVQSAEDDKIIVNHFEPATPAHCRYRVAVLGITSDYHVQELVTSALQWLAEDDFARYDRSKGRHRDNRQAAADLTVRCCFISSCAGKYTYEDIMGAGADGFLQKPFHLKELRKLIQESIGKNCIR